MNADARGRAAGRRAYAPPRIHAVALRASADAMAQSGKYDATVQHCTVHLHDINQGNEAMNTTCCAFP